MTRRNQTWRAFPQEMLSFISQYYTDGESYGVIAERVNKAFEGYSVTRNAMAGVIFRLQKAGKLALRMNRRPSRRLKNATEFKPGHAVRPPRNRPLHYNTTSRYRRLKETQQAKKKYKEEPVKPTNLGKLFMDLFPNECKFALGAIADPPKWFCGASCEDGSPWCRFHHQIVYTKPYRASPASSNQVVAK